MNHSQISLCAELEAYLPDYLDGQARESICRAIAEHLASCANCRIVIDTVKKTILLYRNAPSEVVPAPVHQRLIKVLNLPDL